ncbi:MAG TPA: hypothetical protein VKR58_01090 [Aquella sp.]|nr:hypothetical protein [Aquella sp.]
MDFYCKKYFDNLNINDQKWINNVVEYLLSHCIREVGAYNKLKDNQDQLNKYLEINTRLFKLKTDNQHHKSRSIDWQMERGILDIIIQSLEIIKLVETIQNEELYKNLAKKNYDLQDFLNKKYYFIKTTPNSYNIPQRVIIFNNKPMLLVDNASIEIFCILSKLSNTNDVFVTFNPYIIEIKERGIQLRKDYGIYFIPDQIITKLINGTIKTMVSHKNTKLQFFIKKNSDSMELSLELIDLDNLQSSTIFIHAKFSKDLLQCTHFDKAIIIYDTLDELININNNLDRHKDNKKVKLYQIDGQFDFKDFVDLVYWGNDRFICVIAECFSINQSQDVAEFYGCL